jgi:hypothetical protein
MKSGGFPKETTFYDRRHIEKLLGEGTIRLILSLDGKTYNALYLNSVPPLNIVA